MKTEACLMPFLVAISTFLAITSFTSVKCQEGPGNPLFLTPYINSGAIDEGRNVSKVDRLPSSSTGIPERESFSGFFAVSEEYNSNLYFWFFPALNNPEAAPVILWLDGGPGASNFISIFTQHGPYAYNNSSGQLEQRAADWTRNHSIIFLESPIGTGFSFTDDPRGISFSSEEAAVNTVEFLRQFFILFPEFLTRQLFIAGTSYGGHMAPAVASAIHRRNQLGADPKILLKTLILLVPWGNTYEQLGVIGDYLYQVGLVDDSSLEYFHAEEAAIRQLISEGKFEEARLSFVPHTLHSGKLESCRPYFQRWTYLMSTPDSHFLNVSGFSSAVSVLDDQFNMYAYEFETYVQRPDFRLAVHAGNLSYEPINPIVYVAMHEEFMMSKAPYVEELLNATTEGYSVFIMSAQFDLIVLHKGVENMVNQLRWSGADGFRAAEREIWKIQNQTVAGYRRKYDKLTYVLLRNAAHFPIGDQPDWCLELTNMI